MKYKFLLMFSVLAINLSCKPDTFMPSNSGLMSVGSYLGFCPIFGTFQADYSNLVGETPSEVDTLISKLESTAESCTENTEPNKSIGLSLTVSPNIVKIIVTKLQEGWEIAFKHLDGSWIKKVIPNSALKAKEIERLKRISKRSILRGDSNSWEQYTEAILKNGTDDDGLRTILVPVMKSMTQDTKAKLFAIIKKNYSSAYHSKHRFVGSGWPPKRAYDAILRYTLDPSTFFSNVKTKEQAMEAWRKYFELQNQVIFEGSDFGRYTPDDVLSIARRMQEYLKSQKEGANGVEILLKGSFPSGKANLRKRNPLDNIADSVMQGPNSSYSDIDFLINKDWEKKIKAIEPDIYNYLVSKEAKALVKSSGAKPFFQTHPHPFDLYAELDGSMMSPIGLRVNQSQITLVIYNPNRSDDLPSREAIEAMSSSAKQALYERWATFIPL